MAACALTLAPLLGATALAPSDGAGAARPAAAGALLEDLTWTELRAALSSGTDTVILPIGGTEQNGPAITLGKHNVRVRVLSQRIASALGNALVAPVVAYVPEGSITPPSAHMRYPGTLSVTPAVFAAELEAAARSLRAAGFRDIVLLGDHGGYQSQLAQIALRLNREWATAAARVHAPPEYYRAATADFARVLREHGYTADEIGTHGALMDTSLQLAVDPGSVRQDVLTGLAWPDPHSGIVGGDPRRASAKLGALGLELIVRESVAAIRLAITQAHRGKTQGP